MAHNTEKTTETAKTMTALEERFVIKIFMPTHPALWFKNTTKSEVMGYLEKQHAIDDPKVNFGSRAEVEAKIRELEKHPNAGYLIFSAQPVR